ncbi:MAG: hypothetical protein LKG11_00740 [Bacilli bacterium]|jgi:TolA-binding protein|nr:hypothetical protein [Bacilli bacterium]
MVKAFDGMSKREIKAAKAAISLFRLLGMTDEEIDMVPKAVRMLPRIIEQQNQIISDQKDINDRIIRMSKGDSGNRTMTLEDAAKALGLGEAPNAIDVKLGKKGIGD